MNRLSVKMVAAGFMAMSLGMNVFGDDDLNYGHASDDYSRYRRERAQGHKETAKPIQQTPGRKVNVPVVNTKPQQSQSALQQAKPVASAPITPQQKEQRNKIALLGQKEREAQAARLETQRKADALKAEEEAKRSRLEQERQAAAERLAAEKLEAEKAERAAAQLSEETPSQIQPTVSQPEPQPEQRTLIQRAWDNKGTLTMGTCVVAALICWGTSGSTTGGKQK
jgi:type IV secretory pathway VirB10-like protein